MKIKKIILLLIFSVLITFFTNAQPLNIDSITVTDVTDCYGYASGALEVHVSGGTPPYLYRIDGQPPQVGNTFTGLIAGTHLLRIYDFFLYKDTFAYITQPPQIQILNEEHTDVIGCYGDGNGSITVTAIGGTGSLVYSINNGADLFPYPEGSTAPNLGAGTYNIQVRDDNMCIRSGSEIEITQPAELIIDNQIVTDVVGCYGDENGSIQITASGGTAPIQYSINDGSTFQFGTNFGPLAPDDYIVVVQDSEGCTVYGDTLTVDGPEQIVITTQTVTPVNTCPGENTGTITLLATGGTGTLFYSVDGGVHFENNGNFTGLYAGTYYVVVQDQNLCTVIGDTLVVDDAPQIIIDDEDWGDVNTCFGDSTGYIHITAHGGFGGLWYSVEVPDNFVDNGGVFDNVPYGSYTIKVRDVNGCIVTGQSPIISQPAQLTITGVVPTPISTCYGDCLGKMAFTTNSGGTPPYEFSLDGGLSFPYGFLAENLCAGRYEVRVRDSHNCVSTYIDSVDILQPTELIIDSYTDITEPPCFGDSTGSITVNVSGGTPPIFYSSNAGLNYVTGGDLSGTLYVPAGDHEIWVRDSKLCVTQGAIITVGQPDELFITSIDSSNVIGCNGDSTAWITINITGGTAPYRFTINGGIDYIQTLNPFITFSNLAVGTYQIRVIDVNDCYKVWPENIVITQPAVLGVNYVSHTNVIGCNGDSTGVLNLSAYGGTGTITYYISNGTYSDNNTTGIFNNLPAGTYSIYVEDTEGCTASHSPVTINEPDVLVFPTVTVLQHVDCYNNSNGQIQFGFPSGGQSPYKYSIEDIPNYKDNNIFTNLPARMYQPRIIDTYGCELVGPDSVEITQPDSMSVSFVDMSTDLLCYGDNNGFIQVLAQGGNGSAPSDYRYSSNNGTTYVYNSGSFTNLSAGNYLIRVKDNKNCTAYLDENTDLIIDTLTIFQPDLLEVVNPGGIIPTNVSCNGLSDGMVQIIAIGGTPHPTQGYKYSIDGGAFSYDEDDIFYDGIFTGLSAGSHTVVIQDENLCETQVYQFSIYEPNMIEIYYLSVQDETCPDSNDGSIEIAVSGGTPHPQNGYLFSLNGGPYEYGDGEFTDLDPGDYTITVQDENGCTSADTTVTIDEAFFSGDFEVSDTEICSSDTILFTRINPEGSSEWNFGDGGTSNKQDSVIHQFFNYSQSPVIYTTILYSTSMLGCKDTTELDITVLPQPEIVFSFNPPVLLFPDSTVQINNNSPGYENFDWEWNFGDGSATHTDHSPEHQYPDCGEYAVFISAENQYTCYSEKDTSYLVTAYPPTAMFSADTTQSCIPLLINFENQSSDTVVSYTWDMGDGNEFINEDPSADYTYTVPGIYDVTLSNIGYCDMEDSYSIPVTVFQNPIVDFEYSPDTVMLPNQPIHCYNLSSEDSELFYWEFGDGGTSNEEDPIYLYSEEGSYIISLTVTSVNKCIDSLSMFTEVVVLPAGEVIFPNAFTPNGNGIYDVFKPYTYHSVHTFHLEIYNRWGERMFYTDDIDVGWNGYFNGQLALQDVYVWRAEGMYLNGTPYELSGSVTLLR